MLLLSKTIPALAQELEHLLTKQGYPDLAAQVPELQIIDRCRCGDDFCATFYTQPRPTGAYGAGHFTLDLSPEKGMLILDVVGSNIACVEVLFRDEVQRLLFGAVP